MDERAHAFGVARDLVLQSALIGMNQLFFDPAELGGE